MKYKEIIRDIAAAGLIAFSFWSVFYPEFTFATEDVYKRQVLGGCAGSVKDEQTVSSETGTSQVADGNEETMELILMEHNPEKYNEDQVIRKELEKKYNIKIKVEQIPAEKDRCV